MLADPQAELAKALGVDFDATPVLGSVRSKRCAQACKHCHSLLSAVQG